MVLYKTRTTILRNEQKCRTNFIIKFMYFVIILYENAYDIQEKIAY